MRKITEECFPGVIVVSLFKCYCTDLSAGGVGVIMESTCELHNLCGGVRVYCRKYGGLALIITIACETKIYDIHSLQVTNRNCLCNSWKKRTRKPSLYYMGGQEI